MAVMVVSPQEEIEEGSALHGVGVEMNSVLGGEVGESCLAVGVEVVQREMVVVEGGMVGREEEGARLGEECLRGQERKGLMQLGLLHMKLLPWLHWRLAPWLHRKLAEGLHWKLLPRLQ